MRNDVIYNERSLLFSNCGDPMHPIRQPAVDKNGVISLEITGFENTDEIIESYYETSSLEFLIKKYLAGDESALKAWTPFYDDLTEYPKNYAEFLNSAIRAENGFMALPQEIREKFNNDWRQWLASAGNDDWLKAMETVLSPEKVDVKEVVPDEQEH